MIERQYDLFEIIPGGRPRWIGAAAGLEHARRRVKDLAYAAPGIDYFVVEFRSRTVVAVASRSRISGRPATEPRRALQAGSPGSS
jgi:hypothetical protein